MLPYNRPPAETTMCYEMLPYNLPPAGITMCYEMLPYNGPPAGIFPITSWQHNGDQVNIPHIFSLINSYLNTA